MVKEDMIVMYLLLRINEIVKEVDSDLRVVYFKQVEYGMYVRMVLIIKLLGVMQMLEIISIKNGIVIDYIEVGKGIKIFNYLKLDKQGYSVVLIINVDSKKFGKKDIIKIENCGDIDYIVLGLFFFMIIIDEVKDENIVKKVSFILLFRV